MLFINDINNNLGNFGLVEPVSSYKDIRIIDFFICNDFLGNDMLDRFESPNISIANKSDLDSKSKQYFFTIKSEDKISMAEYILSDIINSNEDFFYRNLQDAIGKTKLYIDEYEKGLKENEDKVEFEQNIKKYQEYICKVNLNFKNFIEKYAK